MSETKLTNAFPSTEALQFANGICRGKGVTDIPQSAFCESDAPTGTTAAPTASEAEETGSATGTVTGTASESEATEEPTATDGDEEATGSETSSPTDTGAAVALSAKGGVMAAVAAAVVALV